MRKRNTRKMIRITVLFIVVIGILIYMEYMLMSQGKETIYKVEVSGVEVTNSMVSQYTAYGTLMLHNGNVSAVSMDYNARIIVLYVENGKTVEKNQELFKVKKLSDNSESTIYADRAGVVEFPKELYVGNIISQYTTVLTIYDLTYADDFYIKGKIPISQYNNINDISGIKVTFGNSISSVVLNGVVEEKYPDVVKDNNSEYYNVYIQVKDPDSKLQNYKLIRGMNVSLLITYRTQLATGGDDAKENYYVIPFNALVARDGENVIFIYDKNGYDYYARMIMVDVLSSNGTTATVKSSSDKLNIKCGVITTGNYKLNGNERVSIDSDN